MADDRYVGTVQRVILDGRHGPYAKALVAEVGIFTFSLDSSVWHERTMPQDGTLVILTDVQKKRAGWRAGSARFMKPSDPESKEI